MTKSKRFASNVVRYILCTFKSNLGFYYFILLPILGQREEEEDYYYYYFALVTASEIRDGSQVELHDVYLAALLDWPLEFTGSKNIIDKNVERSVPQRFAFRHLNVINKGRNAQIN